MDRKRNISRAVFVTMLFIAAIAGWFMPRTVTNFVIGGICLVVIRLGLFLALERSVKSGKSNE